MGARAGGRTRAVEVADRLHSAAIHLLRWLRREDEAAGLSPARLSALSVVVFGGPLPIGEVARAEQVRPPTMTRLVHALERDGLVAREPDPTDGRVTRVRATAAGERVLAAGRRRRIERLARGLAGLGAAELALLERAAAEIEALVRADAERLTCRVRSRTPREGGMIAC